MYSSVCPHYRACKKRVKKIVQKTKPQSNLIRLKCFTQFGFSSKYIVFKECLDIILLENTIKIGYCLDYGSYDLKELQFAENMITSDHRRCR